MGETGLILAALAGMALLLFLIVALQMHAFVALLASSLLIGLAAGMDFDQVLASVTTGMGGTLGTIAVLVGLGAMFGQMLEASGGAEALARSLLSRFGEERAPWSLALTGFLVAIPVFLDVAFIILVSLVYGLTRKTGRPVVYYGLPLLAGLAATHAFIPPTPGPIAVALLLGADLGWVILFGMLAGLPATVIAGPLFARFAATKVTAGVPSYMTPEERSPEAPLPPVGLIVTLMGLPLVLILAHTLVGTLLSEDLLAQRSSWTPRLRFMRDAVVFVGHPIVALLITTLLCFRLLGTGRGLDRPQVQRIASKALEPAGIVILVTGAGGILKEVLVDSGVADVMATRLMASALPPLALGFIVAALLRVMQGSATVAMLSGAALVAAMIEGIDLDPPMRALLVISIASGATLASHVNDSGFWLVNRYFGLSVPDTLRTWTMATTLIGCVGFSVVLAIGWWIA